MRFANSGTEAVMMAVRAARAFTGREKIIKAEGGYDGMWEQVPVSWDRIDADFEKHLEEIRNFLRCLTVSASDDMLAGAERVAAMIEGAGGTAEMIPTAETEHAWMDWSDEPSKSGRRCGCFGEARRLILTG